MKNQQEISPWKVTQRNQTKQFNEDNHFSLPKKKVELRKQSVDEQQNIIKSSFSSIELSNSNSGLKLAKSNSLASQWVSKKLIDRRDEMKKINQNAGFRPTPPLVSTKKTYKYHEIMGNTNNLFARQSTPIIKQRMQILLKNYDLPEINTNYLKSMIKQRPNRAKEQKREAVKTNIQFMYKSEVKSKKGGEFSPSKQIKMHILDSLLSQFE